MSKKSNPTLIGSFVIGAVLLLVAGVMLFGGSEYFAKRLEYVSYFEEQTKGLRVGSNVLLNGVRIGYVTDISLIMDSGDYETLTRVTMELLPENLIVVGEGDVDPDQVNPREHDEMIKNAGVRAQLETESIVTGQLVVKLTMRPGSKVVMHGEPGGLPEIPTITSDAAAVINAVHDFAARLSDNFDVDELGQRINSILAGIDDLAQSEDLRNILSGVDDLVNSDATQGLSGDLSTTLQEFRATAESITKLSDDADVQLADLATDLKPALARLGDILDEAHGTLAAAKEHMRGETVQSYQLNKTLHELEGAARAIRDFFDYLERHPESLIKGKNK